MKYQDNNSRLFNALSSLMKPYNSDWNPVGFAAPADAAPASPATNDLWFPEENGTYANFLNSEGAPVVVEDYKKQVIVRGTDGYKGELIKDIETKLFYTGKNKFDKSRVRSGYYVNPLTGGLAESGLYSASELFVKIEANTSYYASPGNRYWALYDELFAYIKGGSTELIETTADTFYIRSSCLTSNLDIFQIEKGIEATAYKPFKLMAKTAPDLIEEWELGIPGTGIKDSSIPKEKMTFSKTIFVSGTEDLNIGGTNFDATSSSYKVWGNRYNFTAERTLNALKLNFSHIIPCIFKIKQGSTTLYEAEITQEEIDEGIILFPETTFESGIAYDFILIFTANKTINFSNSSIGQITTALYGATEAGLATYPKPAITSFSLIYLSDLVFEASLLLSSTDIQDFETAVNSVVSGGFNEFSIPSIIYAYTSERNDFNFKNILKYTDRPQEYIRFSAITNYKNKATATPSANASITVQLLDANFVVIQSKVITMNTKSASNISGTPVVVTIGDSLTEGGRWHDKAKQLLTTKINFEGIIQSLQGDASSMTEGRSGWSMTTYFAMSKSASAYYSPFMHPAGKEYFGVVEKNAAELTDTSRGGMYLKLSEIGFTAGGYPSSPTTNVSVVYSIANARYEIWNGSAWVDAGLVDGDFSFNFATYRSAWNIPAVDVLYVMLGTNDFRNLEPSAVSAAFVDFASKMDEIITSAKADNAAIKIGVGIPNIYVGSDDNNGGYFNTKLSRSMYNAKTEIISEYDGRTAESIYVVDWGLAFDSEEGFDKVSMDPFIDANGTDSLILDGNTPHPGITNKGYFPMGQFFAAWISSLGL